MTFAAGLWTDLYFSFTKKSVYCIFLRFWEVTKDATDFINFIETRKVEKRERWRNEKGGGHKSSFKYTTRQGYVLK